MKALHTLLASVAIVVSMSPVAARASTNPLVVIVLENKPASEIIGNPDAPFINSMVQQGHWFSSYTAITNGSLHNYLAMTAGITTKNGTVPNVFQGLDASGISWTEFEESETGPCTGASTGTVPDTRVKLYTKAHDPAIQFTNDSCGTNDIPLTSSFDPAMLSAFNYVVPNQCDDMHTLGAGTCPAYFGTNSATSSVAMGDQWVSAFVQQVAPYATVLLTWDEGKKSDEHILTVAYGIGVTQLQDSAAYTHYNLESGLYSYFALGPAPGGGSTELPLPLP
jgi:phosphatidylinositol-3-phosphatase